MLFAIRLIIETLGRIFSIDYGVRSKSQFPATALKATALAIVILIVAGHPFMLTNTPSLIIFQISVASIFIAVTSAYLARWSPSFDFVIFANISVLQLILLFKADDLISVFFLLELLNSLIIYSFLFSYDTKAQRHAVSSSRMAVACAYQIVLNFFSSILLYSGVNTYIAVTGGPKLCFAHLFNDCAYSYAPLLIVLGLFIKLGTGP